MTVFISRGQLFSQLAPSACGQKVGRMPFALRKPCSAPGCPELVRSGRCEAHTREAEERRGSSADRGYRRRGHGSTFREAVLARDPFCVLCHRQWSVQADHYPKSRRELVALGMNPNDPQYGRGLCTACHSKETAKLQPGGWNRPQ